MWLCAYFRILVKSHRSQKHPETSFTDGKAELSEMSGDSTFHFSLALSLLVETVQQKLRIAVNPHNVSWKSAHNL